ncbi:S16 family serine protease [Aeropyrum pernix]|uniref:S16 family serine protease n=1 Tax=Aeropyrum pernix TaxID=56636 RepID=UPI001038159A|nr:S16 family serine protease [Aeropyrum pernix]
MRIIVYLAVLLTIILVASAPALTALSNSEDGFQASCESIIVAVSSSGEGATGRLIVTVRYPGEGRVYISTSPASQLDTLGSARVAAFAASLAAGVDMSSLDFYYVLESKSIVVGGPSAGLAMALATYSLLTTGSCPDGYAATGMILPDTSVGPVGGLKEKLEAAASSGAKVFLIPHGQEKYTYIARKVERNGPIVRIVSTPISIDLVEYGRSLGVNVIGVSTLAEAAGALGLPVPEARVSPSPSQQLTTTLSQYTLETVNLARSLAGDSDNVLAQKALELSDRALDLANNGFYYASAVYATLAYSYARASIEVSEAKDGDFDVTELVEESRNSIAGVMDKLRGIEEVTVANLDAVLKAYGVLGEASYEYSNGLGMLVEKNGRYFIPVSILGEANYEGVLRVSSALSLARWAGLWATVAEASQSGAPLEGAVLEKLARVMESQAATTTAYVIQIGSETGKRGYERAEYLVSLALSTKDNPLEIAGYSIEAMAAASSYLHEAFTLDPEATAQGITALAGYIASRLPEDSSQYPKAALASIDAMEGIQLLLTSSKALLYLEAVALALGIGEKPSSPGSNLESTSTETSYVTTLTRESTVTVTRTIENIVPVEHGVEAYSIAILLVAILSLLLGAAISRMLR